MWQYECIVLHICTISQVCVLTTKHYSVNAIDPLCGYLGMKHVFISSYCNTAAGNNWFDYSKNVR